MRALAVTAGIVFWTLVLGIMWLALFPGTDSGEPVAVLQVEPAPEAAPAQGAAKAPAGEFDFPPGFAVTGPSGHPEAPAAAPPMTPGTSFAPLPGEIGVPDLPDTPGESAPPAAEIPPGVDDRRSEASAPEDSASSAPETTEPEAQGATLATPQDSPATPVQEQAAIPASPEPAEDTGPISLVPAPVADLVEESQYGPLPKVAADGKRPAEIYARPSRYAARAGMGEPARVAILVNGLGLPDGPSDDVLKGLPPPISVAYGAYGRGLQDLVTKARAAGHEVLLQIPLEPNDYPNVDPGPHTLLTTLPAEENIKRLQWLMSRYTGYVGVTNHMGAKFEATKDSFLPVLEELKRRGLIYVDDGSVASSTAGQIASVVGLDYSLANVQIDAKPSAADIAKALAQLETLARERGAAIGVVKARPETVRQLADWAGKLEAKGIVLVPVSAAVRSQRQS